MSDPSPQAGAEAHVDIDQLIHHTVLPPTRTSRVLDAVVKGAGDLLSWVWLILVGVIVLNVTLRYVFGRGYIAFEEIQWHLYAVGWLIGLSYCVQNDSHIRIDIFHERFSLRTKAWVDFLGILFLLIPYTLIVLIYSPPFIEFSFRTGEISDAPGGLPYRWAIKSTMWIAYAILLGAAISRLLRAAGVVFGASGKTVGRG